MTNGWKASALPLQELLQIFQPKQTPWRKGSTLRWGRDSQKPSTIRYELSPGGVKALSASFACQTWGRSVVDGHTR